MFYSSSEIEEIGFKSIGENVLISEAGSVILPGVSLQNKVVIGSLSLVTKKHNVDLELPYPDLSKFEIYTK